MSIITSNCEQISRAPTNTSKAKQLFSFPKGDRFGKKAKHLTEVIGYDLPTTISSR